ncbi:hypothetical protein ACN47E_005681 [Coniothyrium glycines]
MSSKDNLALDLEHGVRRWDRARWISVFSSHNPTIREVTECLGLGLSASSSTTNRGIPKFDNPDYRKLSSEVTKLSKELPKERDALLDFAADPHSLDNELDELLRTYGPAIWGRDADRSCLLTPDPTKKTYNTHLFFDIADHKDILKVHLHRWIIIKACYYIRNMKLKRPSGANEYDTLADMDGDGISPHGTPHSLTPPERGMSAGTDLEVKPINLKKRKSNAHLSMSDGDDPEGTPAKRPYSTMPISRKSSPRKSLKSLYPIRSGSAENVPPPPNHSHQPSPTPGPGLEAPRTQLNPLSSNELNGVASRFPATTQSPATGGFISVNNSGAFTAVNNTPPTRDPSRDPPTAITREPQQLSPLEKHRHMNNYTSPYEPASRNSAPAQIIPGPGPSPKSAHPILHAAPVAQRPEAVSVPASRGSPATQHPHHAHIAPQPQAHTPQQSSPRALYRSNVQQPQAPAYAHPNVSQHSQVHQQPSQQPPSRTNTPSHHHIGRSLAPHPPSRSSTPLAQAANHQPPPVPNSQGNPASHVQSAPTYGIQLVPTQEPTAQPSTHRSLPTPAQPVAAPHQPHPHHPPVLKSHSSEPMQGVQVAPAIPRTSISTADVRMLQCEVTAGLFTCFFPRSTAATDEPTLLRNMNTLWYHGESLFRVELGPHFDLISKVLTLWLHERSAITALKHSMASYPGVNAGGLVDRLLAMNDIRIMRLKWKNMSTVEGLSPEDLLCQAFKVMTNTEGSDHLFKEGLDRLNSGVFEFLRNEDAKIVMHRR